MTDEEFAELRVIAIRSARRTIAQHEANQREAQMQALPGPDAN